MRSVADRHGQPIADLTFDDRDAVERLALPLSRQLKMAKAFVRQIECTVNSPQLVTRLSAAPALGPWSHR